MKMKTMNKMIIWVLIIIIYIIILLNQIMKINKKLPLKIKIWIMNNTNNLTEMMNNLSLE